MAKKRKTLKTLKNHVDSDPGLENVLKGNNKTANSTKGDYLVEYIETHTGNKRVRRFGSYRQAIRYIRSMGSYVSQVSYQRGQG